MTPEQLTDSVQLYQGDCLDVLRAMPSGSVDAVVTDPPYELTDPRSGGDGTGRAFAPRTPEMKERRRGGFMGKAWDGTGVSFDPATWAAVLGAVKPGGYLLAFAGSRTQHRIGCAIEDGGWEIRDTLLWLYGTGFPKGKGCLKPAYEPVILARRPGPKVLPLGVDECRVPTDGEDLRDPARFNGLRAKSSEGWSRPHHGSGDDVARQLAAMERAANLGRYPANVLLGYPEDEYILRSDVTPDQRTELFRWLYEDAKHQVPSVREAVVPSAERVGEGAVCSLFDVPGSGQANGGVVGSGEGGAGERPREGHEPPQRVQAQAGIQTEGIGGEQSVLGGSPGTGDGEGGEGSRPAQPPLEGRPETAQPVGAADDGVPTVGRGGRRKGRKVR